MPIYIATESTKLKIPDDWDGTKETWPLFKMRMEMACQKVNMTFLTTDATTTELTANALKKFAESLHEKAPQSALVDFLGSDRDFYRTRGIEMFQRLRSIYEPTHPNAISGIIEQLSSIRMKTGETPSAFKLRIELLNERLPKEVAYTPALLAHVAYKGLDKTRYSSFQENVRNGNKRVETLVGLFQDLETFDNMELKESTPEPAPILKNATAKKVTFDKSPTEQPPDASPFDWKGQKDLNTNQANWLLRKFTKGCIVCRTNAHEFVACPVIKDKFNVERINKSSSRTPEGSARPARANTSGDADPTPMTTAAPTDADAQGKCSPSVVSSVAPELSLSSITTSDSHLTSDSPSSQASNHLSTELNGADGNQWGGLRQETVSLPQDPSIDIDAMRIHRDNASRIAIAQAASSLFVCSPRLCMGRASKVSLDRIIRSGYACIDSGATHDMSNGQASDFANYRSLPKGSHVLVADNHPIECLGVGTKIWRIGGPRGHIVARREVLHVPALKAPLFSVRQHRRHQGCSFVADNKGCYLTFPTFSVPVDDSTDCLIAYETINPVGFDFSSCDYIQSAPAIRESLATVETQRAEDDRKSRSSSNSANGNAWKVETRASTRRLKEQLARFEESTAHAQQIKDEVTRLMREAEESERQATLSRPEAPLTEDEKRQLIQALVNSMQANGETDYLLVKDIESRYPRPYAKLDDNISKEAKDSNEDETAAYTLPSKPKGPKLPTTSTPADHPDTLPCDKAPSASPAVQCFTEQQLHRYFGFRNLKNWMDLQQTGQDTIKIVKGNELPLELGDVANIRHSRRNTIPIP